MKNGIKILYSLFIALTICCYSIGQGRTQRDAQAMFQDSIITEVIVGPVSGDQTDSAYQAALTSYNKIPSQIIGNYRLTPTVLAAALIRRLPPVLKAKVNRSEMAAMTAYMAARFSADSAAIAAANTRTLTPGPKGDKGDKGDAGLTGPQGIAGPQGIQGVAGATGPAGTNATTTASATSTTAGLMSAADKGKLTNMSGKRQEAYTGTTNASGTYSVTFTTGYSSAPNIQAQLIGGTDLTFFRIVSVSATGFQVYAFTRSSITSLPVVGTLSQALLGSTATALSGAQIDVLITEK